jgi:hypothetical protein
MAYGGHAQVIKEDTTTNAPFFAAKKFNSKFYVSLEGAATQILKKKAAMTVGLGLNWVINHKYVVSAKYNVLSTPVNVRMLVAPDRSDTILLRYQSAGLGFSYILFHNKKFSLQPELIASWAMIKYQFNGGTWYRHFGVITPAVYGVYNCTKYFRFGIGLNYRVTAGATLIKDSYLSGIGGVVFMRVGTF